MNMNKRIKTVLCYIVQAAAIFGALAYAGIATVTVDLTPGRYFLGSVCFSIIMIAESVYWGSRKR